MIRREEIKKRKQKIAKSGQVRYDTWSVVLNQRIVIWLEKN